MDFKQDARTENPAIAFRSAAEVRQILQEYLATDSYQGKRITPRTVYHQRTNRIQPIFIQIFYVEIFEIYCFPRYLSCCWVRFNLSSNSKYGKHLLIKDDSFYTVRQQFNSKNLVKEKKILVSQVATPEKRNGNKKLLLREIIKKQHLCSLLLSSVSLTIQKH